MKALNCYISSPADFETAWLKRMLNSLEVETFDAYDFEFSTSVSLKSRIRKADFAIAFLSNLNVNVIYEIGVCEG